jgi:NAD(P)-dependent dehydrogenase (short-subunit alcohol dehydrogenase family)
MPPQGVSMAKEKSGEGTLAGQVAVVTGSTQGIGAGIAKRLAECGARVVVHGLAKQKAGGEKVLAAVRASGSEGLLVLGDLKDEAHCRDIIRQTVERFGQLDILVNNAGIYTRGNIENTSVTLWDEIFAINLRAPFILCQEAVKLMKERKRGCIINIGSVNAYIGLRKVLAYSAAKGGLMTFTKNLANYLTQYKIRVNQINPGWVLTEGEHHMNSVLEGKGENWLEDALKTRPFGRLLAPDDIANAVLFFAANELLSGAVLDYEQLPFGAPVDLESPGAIVR